MNSTEIFQENRVADPKLKQALASLRLEGLVLSDESLTDAVSLYDGKMSKEEFTQRAISRATA